MNCLDYQELTNLFLDGELETNRQVELFKHIAQCGECQLFVETMNKMKEIKDKEDIPFPPVLDDRFFHTLAERRLERLKNNQKEFEPLRFWKKRVVLSIPFAAIVIILAIFGGALIGGMLEQTSEEKMLFALQQGSQPHPTAVIMVYELPPIDVIGKPIFKQARYDSLYQY